MTAEDAYQFPLYASCGLGGLYVLFKVSGIVVMRVSTESYCTGEDAVSKHTSLLVCSFLAKST